MGVLLVALSVMAPGPPDKAENLRVDSNDWERVLDTNTNKYVSTFTIDMSCKFGLATAAEHNDKYMWMHM